MIIRKIFKAETSHRLIKAFTRRCHGLHGHSYVFEVFLHSESQDDSQMLMDFTLLSERFHNFLDSFDHSLIIWNKDKELVELAPKLNPRYIVVPYNTTSEQLSRHIYYEGLKINLPIYKIVVHETQNCCAEFSGDDTIKIDLDNVIFSQTIQDGWK
ncbi:6-carboxytetrahydropterin synthase [bacterium]|nr:6-carboxytetrahydropterin synthase [bacterium]